MKLYKNVTCMNFEAHKKTIENEDNVEVTKLG